MSEREDVTGDDLVLLAGRTVNQNLYPRSVNILFPKSNSTRISISTPRDKNSVTYTSVVDNLDNGSQLAGVRTAADEHQAANLNEPPRGDLNIDIGHGEGLPEISEFCVTIFRESRLRWYSRSTNSGRAVV